MDFASNSWQSILPCFLLCVWSCERFPVHPFVFGAANAFLYTLSFYKDNPQYGFSLPPVGIIFIALLIRGPLMVLGAALLAQSVSVSRRQLAVWLGLLLFVVDGLAAYVEGTFRTMPLGFNMATLAELFFQNFLTGVVVAYLFGNQSQRG